MSIRYTFVTASEEKTSKSVNHDKSLFQLTNSWLAASSLSRRLKS